MRTPCLSFHPQHLGGVYSVSGGALRRRPLVHRSSKPFSSTAQPLCTCRATLARPDKPAAKQTNDRPRHGHSAPRNDLVHFEALKLEQHDPDNTDKLDLIVAGAGPSGIAVAERVSAAGYKVCVVDPAPLAHWPNNYGVWVDEFEAMGLDDCLEIIWSKAKVHLDTSTERCNIQHPAPECCCSICRVRLYLC